MAPHQKRCHIQKVIRIHGLTYVIYPNLRQNLNFRLFWGRFQYLKAHGKFLSPNSKSATQKSLKLDFCYDNNEQISSYRSTPPKVVRRPQKFNNPWLSYCVSIFSGIGDSFDRVKKNRVKRILTKSENLHSSK